MKRISCFIACAFNNPEVDQLYEIALKVALNSLNINHFRVDKLNHNENIDLKILELIKKSDFGITDLTYARPSVYFEAGYLEGQNKPVIYLARKDHFQSKVEDKYGNLKIHFDLITRNIIAWDTLDNDLINAIKERISLVSNPIKMKLLEIEELENQTRIFKSLSLTDRLKKLNDLTLKVANETISDLEILHKNYLEIVCNGIYRDEKTNFIIIIKETFTKSNLKEYHPAGQGFGFIIPRFIKDPFEKKVVIFISLRKIRNSTLDSALFWCKKHSEDYFENTEMSVPIKYLIVDSIENEAQYLDRLKSSINKIKNSS